MARRSTGGDTPQGAAPVLARRLRRPRFGDARLWLGLLLVVGAMGVGARVMSAEDDSVVVLRATRDLSVGGPMDGLEPVRVARAVAGDAYLVDAPPIDAVLRWPVRAGELVPSSAVSTGVRAPVRLVTIPVDPLHAPATLVPGDLVDVWSSPREPASADLGAPSLVQSGVTVAAVATGDVGLGGEIGIVLTVPVEDVDVVVGAARAGVIDLVAVPADSQTAGSMAAATAPSP